MAELACQQAAAPDLDEQAISVDQSAPKVDIAIFTYRTAKTAVLFALHEMHMEARRDGIDTRLMMYGSSLIDLSRSRAIASMRQDAEAILFVDDDMIPPPGQHVVRELLAHGKDITAPLYTTREEPVRLVVRKYDLATDTLRAVDELSSAAEGKAIEGPLAVGLAFTLIRRRAIDAILDYHLSARDWLEENRRLFDRLHVRNERREEERRRVERLRRAAWEKDRTNGLFDRVKLDDGTYLGEDISFCRRALQCGMTVTLDCRLNLAVGHSGDYAFGVWDFNTVNNHRYYAALLSDQHPGVAHERESLYRMLMRATQ